MRIDVLLFARAREAAGSPRLELELEDGTTVGDCFREVARRAPAFEALRSCLAVAVNEAYADWEQPLRCGDTVAFIPPVSGG